MNLKRLGTALAIAVALAAVMASDAFAAATTQSASWKVGSGHTVLSGSKTVTAEATGSITIATSISGLSLQLEATGVECIECTIFNSSGAKGEGKLKFNGVTVATPSACKVNGGSITTEKLKLDATYMVETVATVLFQPVTGTTFAKIKLEDGSGVCMLSGNHVVSGTLFGQWSTNTGFYTANQPVSFSEAVNTNGGGTLSVGVEAASVTGSVSLSIGGEVFGVE